MEFSDYETMIFYNYYKNPKIFRDNIKISKKKLELEFIDSIQFKRFCLIKIQEKREEIIEIVEKHISMCNKNITHLKLNEKEEGENKYSIKNWELSKIKIRDKKHEHLFNVFNDNYTCILKSYAISMDNIDKITEIINESFFDDEFHKVYNCGWFQVGLRFATGDIFKFYDDGLSSTQIAESLFPEKPSKYRSYISSSIEKIGSDKNIFSSKQKMSLLARYCEINNIKMHSTFLAKLNLLK